MKKVLAFFILAFALPCAAARAGEASVPYGADAWETPALVQAIDAWAARAKAADDRFLTVEVHAAQGTREYAISLTQNIADRIAEALIAKGVDKDQLRALGLGREYPACAEETPACAARNRRIRFSLD